MQLLVNYRPWMQLLVNYRPWMQLLVNYWPWMQLLVNYWPWIQLLVNYRLWMQLLVYLHHSRSCRMRDCFAFLLSLTIVSPKLGIIFRMLNRHGSLPECWRSANVTAIPKGAPSPDRKNERPISITRILSNVYEKLVSHKLSRFCEKYVFYLPLSLLIGKVWATLMHC